MRIRLPECLISIFTAAIVSDLVPRVSDSRIALATVLLPATGAVFNGIWCNCRESPFCLDLVQGTGFTAAFFRAGVLLWDKANIVFPLVGVGLGSALIYPGAIRQADTPERLARPAAGH